jgi:hypothetical protein
MKKTFKEVSQTLKVNPFYSSGIFQVLIKELAFSKSFGVPVY